MFFGTPSDLLGPVHSLLKSPFGFEASVSINTKLRARLQDRADFEQLLALGCLFDQARHALQQSMVLLRTLLENEVAMTIPMDADLSTVFGSRGSPGMLSLSGMSGEQYLRYVSVQCQLERLFDHYRLQRSGTTNPLQIPSCVDALKFLMLGEALALALAGIASVSHDQRGFELAVGSVAAKGALRNTWFARAADQCSSLGTLALAKQLADQHVDHISKVENLTERILDQDLSLPWYRMSSAGRALKSVRQIHFAAGVVALCTVLGLSGKSLKMSAPGLGRHGLDFSSVSALLQRQAGALITDQFLLRDGDMVRLRPEASSKGLRQLFRLLEKEFCERDALRIHAGGFFYEKTHIRQRIEQGPDYHPRYRILDGFDRHQVIGGAPSECDIEFIIEDTQQNHFYFIQVKHALLGEKAFLEAAIAAIQKDIGKGLHQLREAKRLLNEGYLDKTLRARSIAHANPCNSSFTLLHNIAQLDFQQTGDEIALYDWATFRNLLKDAECSYGRTNGPVELIRLATPLVIKHPTAVIERLLSEHPAYQQTFKDPWAQERFTTPYDVMGTAIRICGLGI
jgi:hypothetical protein